VEKDNNWWEEGWTTTHSTHGVKTYSIIYGMESTVWYGQMSLNQTACFEAKKLTNPNENKKYY